jgi:hypothetical protein
MTDEQATKVDVPFGSESERVDRYLSTQLDADTRRSVWNSVESILAQGQYDGGASNAIGLALGYVQSGKTTTITALIAAAADAGYRVIIALLGGTNLLLGQNESRIEKALEIGDRSDYRWKVEPNPKGRRGAKSLIDWLERGRVIFVPVLKHAGRIRDLAGVLASVPLAGLHTLIVDDEADQASLNTAVRQSSESRTYEAIGALRKALPNHLYVQFTATPYAPLLLEPDDHLLPSFIEFLHPGPGYIGGREFFVDYADKVVRPIPALDEQASKSLPIELPSSLINAFASFVAGAALLLNTDPGSAPISMLVHSTQRNDVQARYFFLLERLLRNWRSVAEDAQDVKGLPDQIRDERERLGAIGAACMTDDAFLSQVKEALREVTLWLVNSVSALNKVDWNVAPIHVLVGGNKLDRGFTVEGLTVTYMNRPTSVQVDTMEQRARAFGYRQDQLPYCQFFATPRTIKVLRDVVYTEYDLRAKLRDFVEQGGSVEGWAHEVGLLLPEGTRPTRDAVVQALSKSATGWHSLRRPSLDLVARTSNADLVAATGLLDGEHVDYGRLRFRTVRLSLRVVIEDLLDPWHVVGYSPDWRHDDILEALRRNPHQDAEVALVLMEDEDGGPRVRKWDGETGFINLFQGRDLQHSPGRSFYPGDRAVTDVEAHPEDVVVQIHRVVRRGHEEEGELLTPAVHLGERPIVRRVDRG